jgi:MazG family protein
VGSSGTQSARELEALDQITRRLRRECPWDREQNERSIVPHTVEEAYELADAAQRGDDRKLLDELGDVLFQVHFLALLLEERGAGDLGAVARHCAQKLIRRHPHVFGDAQARSAAEVLRNWDQIKRAEDGREPGLFGEVPENLPALLYARKLQRRAASGGAEAFGGSRAPDATLPAAFARLRERLGRLERAESRQERFAALGELLFAAVALARELDVDPELALRAAAERFRDSVERRMSGDSAEEPKQQEDEQ